jgi:ABC-type glycerol-3-phosphate transport system substrate-binding protein
MLTHKTAWLALAAALVLAACGGGDDDEVHPPPPPVATAVPDSAVASSTALVNYLKGQKADDETSEALTLPSVDIAISETEEPQSL